MQKAGGLDEHGKPIVDLARGMKSVEQGAATSVWAATSPRLNGMGGVYCEDSDIAVIAENDQPAPRGATAGSGVRRWAIDPQAAQRLWTLSERLTGVAIS